MEAFQRGTRAFETAYDHYADMLYRLALSRVHHPEDAEDIVQEVFLKYMASYHKLRDDEHERAWLVRVTINHCNDHLRHHKRRRWVSIDEVVELAEETPSTLLRETLDYSSKLPDKIRTVILLHYLEGYAVQEVAQMLGISLSACKMRLARGRKQLEQIKQKEDPHV